MLDALELRSISKPVTPTFDVPKGHAVFEQGDEGNELYIIASGAIEIRIDGSPVAVLGKEDMFGEMALIEDSPRSATAVAKARTTLIPISKRDFFALVRRNPEFALDVIRMLSRRLRRMNQIY